MDRKSLIATLKDAGQTGAFQRMTTAALADAVAALTPAPPVEIVEEIVDDPAPEADAPIAFDFSAETPEAVNAAYKQAWTDNVVPGTKNPPVEVAAALSTALRLAMEAHTSRKPKARTRKDGSPVVPRVEHPLLTASNAIKKGRSKIDEKMRKNRKDWDLARKTAEVAKLRAEYPGITVRIVTEHLYWTLNVKCSEAGIKTIFEKADAPEVAESSAA